MPYLIHLRNILCLLLVHLTVVAQKPEVLIITTGGTIASQTNAPLIEGSELISAVPDLQRYANVRVVEIFRTGSSKMTPDHWLQLTRFIDSVAVHQPQLTCIVVTHGTDTMEETAFFLHLTHRHALPIVLTGSMRSSNEVSADGPANLIQALRVGIHPQTVGKGVLVVLNENISGARDLIKMHNRRVDTFGPGQYGYLGFVSPDTIIYYRDPIQPHTRSAPFELQGISELPNVELLTDYAGFDPSILGYFFSRPNAGLVVGTFAGGRISTGVTEALRQLLPHEKPIVLASNIKSGWIEGSYTRRRPWITANDLPPNKARILLMLALTQTRDPEKIQAYFQRY
jgi:L-asparaginase